MPSALLARYRAVRAERAGDWAAAADAWACAVTHAPGRAGWQHRLGRARVRSRDREAAIEAYEAALALDPGQPRWAFQLGQLHHRAGRVDDARRALQMALAADGSTEPWEHRLLARSTWQFRTRRDVARFVAEHVDSIRSTSRSPAADDGPLPVFVYWGTGVATAPALVRRCVAELEHRAPAGSVVVLDESLVHHYVSIPADVQARVRRDPTKFSNLVRLALLERYGGVWLDATCLLSEPVEPAVEVHRRSGFFAFRHPERMLSSWFLAARPGNYVVSMLLKAHYTYWRHHERAVHYHVFNMLFEALYLLDERFAAAWDATPELDGDAPYELQRVMYEPYDEERWQALVGGSFIHKLTHKLDLERLEPDSMIATWVRGDAPR